MQTLVVALRQKPVSLTEVTSIIERNPNLASSISRLSRTEQSSTAIAIVSLGTDALLGLLGKMRSRSTCSLPQKGHSNEYQRDDC